MVADMVFYNRLRSIFFIFSTALAIQNVSAQQLSSVYNDAVERIRLGDFEGGCAEAKKLADKYPGFYAVYNLLGLCATRRGDAREAQLLFRKSIQLNPKFVSARINLAVNLLQSGNRQEAIAQFVKVLELDPNNVTALYNLGKIKLAIGSVDEAIEHLRRASERAPDDVQVTIALTDAMLASKQKGPARDLINQIIQRQQDSRVLISAALLAIQAEEESLAREGLEKAVRLDARIRADILALARMASTQQRYRVVRVLLDVMEQAGKNSAEWNALQGYSDYKLGDPARALERLRRAIELDPYVEDYYMKIGEMMLFYKSDQAAIAFFKVGLEKLPNSALLHFGLAVSYMVGNTNPEAMHEHLERALKLQPSFQPALSLLCLISYRERDWVRLQDAAQRLISLNPISHEGYYYKAVALIEGQFNGKQHDAFQKAKQLLEQSIKLNPNFADPHIALGKLLIRVGHISQALTHFERAVTLDPNKPEAHYHLAMAYRKAGQREKSEQFLHKYQKLKEQEPSGWEVLFQVSK